MKMTKENVAVALNIYEKSAAELLNGTVKIKGSEVKEIARYYDLKPAEVLACNPGLTLERKKHSFK